MNTDKIKYYFLQTSGVISFAIGFCLMLTSFRIENPLVTLMVAPTLIYGVAAPIFAILYKPQQEKKEAT